MRLSFVNRFLATWCLFALCSCSRNDSEEVARLKQELDTAKAEAALAKAELAQLRTPKKDDPNPPVAAPAKDEGLLVQTRTYHVLLWLPRFDGRMVDDKISPTFEEVQAAQKGLPCLPKNGTYGYGDNNGRRMVQFTFLPTAESDLGDVAKALSKLGGDKKKSVATLSLAARIVYAGEEVPAEEAKLAALKKELAHAKGIDWEKSNRFGLALDEAGGAKFLEIRAAYKKASITLVDGLDEK